MHTFAVRHGISLQQLAVYYLWQNSLLYGECNWWAILLYVPGCFSKTASKCTCSCRRFVSLQVVAKTVWKWSCKIGCILKSSKVQTPLHWLLVWLKCLCCWYALSCNVKLCVSVLPVWFYNGTVCGWFSVVFSDSVAKLCVYGQVFLTSACLVPVGLSDLILVQFLLPHSHIV